MIKGPRIRWGVIALALGLGASGLGYTCESRAEPETEQLPEVDQEAPVDQPEPKWLGQIDLAPVEGYPVWLEADGMRTDQTSGIAWIPDSDPPMFMTCDDVGAIHRLKLDESKRQPGQTDGDGWMVIEDIAIPDDLKRVFGTGPAKLDIEEIVFLEDGFVAVSVEGNSSDSEAAADPTIHERRNGLFALHLQRDNNLVVSEVASPELWWSMPELVDEWPDTLTDATRREVGFPEIPRVGIGQNRGFEGVGWLSWGVSGLWDPGPIAVYLSPEIAYEASERVPSYWHGRLPIYLVADTRSLGPTDGIDHHFEVGALLLPTEVQPESICGLATSVTSDGVPQLYVLDRNANKVHRCTLIDGVTLTDVLTAKLSMPGPSGIPYFLPSPEAITLDWQKNLWIVVDPWQYNPLPKEGQVLSDEERQRYADKIPMLYKFPPMPATATN